MPDYAGEDLEGENKKSADPGTFGETPQTFPPYVLEPKPTKPETGADKTRQSLKRLMRWQKWPHIGPAWRNIAKHIQ